MCLDPLVGTLIHLRERFRKEKKWHEADAIRDSLTKADIFIEDLNEGARWRLKQ
jgi:cysteinyl-tRNA synthetase